MKNIFTIIFALSPMFIFSQVAIGKTAVTNSSVSLEFGNGNKGIILPWVTSTTAVTGAVDGTIIFDTSDKKVKYRKNSSWFDLSKNNTGTVDLTIQNPLTESVSAKVSIGTNGATDTTSGILVLTDTDKVMVLPKMASPHLYIINPAPGMMAYDTFNHLLSVYDGSMWAFWKP
ncbi:hypothetical protein [Epilithonimonas hungarica]|uniref:Uncharacterized protein n=1 Tax=Epilithonimonas hungarica TaxID=454006 RepID=A0A1G7JG33_9FLAO|nr:hypothetical protein [Epilithonimonas hungarica]SDF23754.1 hypothetical protein SAMN05421825_1372 [Epilithonimonas hungarica]